MRKKPTQLNNECRWRHNSSISSISAPRRSIWHNSMRVHSFPHCFVLVQRWSMMIVDFQLRRDRSQVRTRLDFGHPIQDSSRWDHTEWGTKRETEEKGVREWREDSEKRFRPRMGRWGGGRLPYSLGLSDRPKPIRESSSPMSRAWLGIKLSRLLTFSSFWSLCWWWSMVVLAVGIDRIDAEVEVNSQSPF